jgi:hypothetical protein
MASKLVGYRPDSSVQYSQAFKQYRRILTSLLNDSIMNLNRFSDGLTELDSGLRVDKCYLNANM